MSTLVLILGIFFVVSSALVATIAAVLIFSKESKVRSRINNPLSNESILQRVLKGTFQQDFSERKRLSIALGLSAKKTDGKIKIMPQGRISKEALIESLGG